MICPNASRGWKKVLAILVGAVAVSLLLAAERLPAPGELEAIFEPFRTDRATMAPDGRHLAYTVREGRSVSVVIADLDQPGSKVSFVVGEDATEGFFQRRVTAAAQLKGLLWADANQLVYNMSVPATDRRSARDEVRVVGANGKNDRKLVDADNLSMVTLAGVIPRPPGAIRLNRAHPEMIFVEVGPETGKTEWYRVELATGKYASLGAEEGAPGRLLRDQLGRAQLALTPPFVTGAAQQSTFDSELPKEERGRYIAETLTRMANNPSDAPFEPPPIRTLDELQTGQADLRKATGPVMILTPQTFRYRSPGSQFAAVTSLMGFDWLKELDAHLGTEAAPTFRASAANFLGRRAFPIAFDANPEVVYVASNVGRDTYGLYAINLVTKQRTDFAIEDPYWDLADPIDAFNESLLVFDRDGRLAGVRASTFDGRTRWVAPELAQLQQKLEANFSDRLVDIIDWDASRRRFLVLVFSLTDPGRYYLVEQRDGPLMTELLRRSPALTAARLNRSMPFAFDTATGVHLAGTLTLPHRSRVVPPPLVMVCRDIPGQRELPEFNREIQAAAAMGFAVATVNYRGTAGFGMKHRDAVRDGFDTIPVEDLQATVAWLTSHYAVNSKRVALFGYGFGGYVALRAAQLFPGEFQCVVAVNAPTDPLDWVNESTMADLREVPDLGFKVRQQFFDRSRLAGRGVIEHVTARDRPVLIIQDPTKKDLRESQGLGLRNALRREGRIVEYVPINGGTAVANPAVRARVFGQIAGFLNEHLYGFRVDVGTEKEVK